VAGAIGLSPRSLSDRLSGRVRPLTTEVVRLAEVLELGLEEILASPPAGPAVELLGWRDRAVYAASAVVSPTERTSEVRVMQELVDEVLAGNWWVAWSPEVRMVVVRRPETAEGPTPPEPAPPEPTAPEPTAWHELGWTSDGPQHSILVPAEVDDLTLLHELAHVAAYPMLWAKAHGPQFLRLWVDLVRWRMGPGPARSLRQALAITGLGLAPRPEVAAGLERGRVELGRLLGSSGPGG
jgi:hypothetical protein